MRQNGRVDLIGSSPAIAELKAEIEPMYTTFKVQKTEYLTFHQSEAEIGRASCRERV